MYLDAVEHLIEPGDVLLFRGGLLHSRVIQRWTRSVYSHVGIVHRPTTAGRSCLDVLEATEGYGIRTFPLRQYLERGDAVDWFAITDRTINRDAVVRWCWDRRGYGYASPRQLLRSFVTVPLLESLGLPTRIDRRRRFCSWLAAEALQAGGYRPPAADELVPELTSPGGVALFTCLQRRGPLRLRSKGGELEH